MKKILLTFLFCTTYSFSQTENVNFDYFGNPIKVSLQRKDSGGFSATIVNSDSGDAKVINLSEDVTISTFTDNVYAQIKSITPKFKFKLSSDIQIELANSTLTYDDVISVLKPDKYKKILRSKFNYNADTTLEKYLSDITDTGKPLFNPADNYIIKKNTVGDVKKLQLMYPESGSLDITTEDNLLTSLSTTSNLAFNQKYILSDADYKKMVPSPIDLNSKNRTLLQELFLKISGQDDYKLINNLLINNIIYAVKVKSETDKKLFILKVCKPDMTCLLAPQMMYGIEWEKFKRDFTAFMSSPLPTGFAENGTIPEYELHLIYNECAALNNDAMIASKIKPFQDKIESLTKEIENLAPKFSGILSVNKSIPVYASSDYKTPVADKLFTIEYATIHFFNNKGKHILVVGSYNNQKFKIENYYHSVRLAAFNESHEYIPISRADNRGEGYYLNFNDIFDYEASDNNFGSAVRNSDYRVEPGKSVKIEERKLADYFTAVIFSDFLGLNSENANALIQAEGRVKIPLWISNKSFVSMISAISADVNASIYNGFDENSRSITPLNAPNGVASSELTMLRINNFDYVKNNNLNAGINLDIFNFEMQRLSTDLNLGYGLRYYRAGVKYNINEPTGDIQKKYQLNALSHEIYANFEIRPQVNFGGDLNIGLNWINARGSVKDIPIEYNVDDNQDDRTVIRVQLNLYSKINPEKSNDGIYARVGGFYHLGAKDFYPQIMVGYATNLSSFVNVFKKK